MRSLKTRLITGITLVVAATTMLGGCAATSTEPASKTISIAVLVGGANNAYQAAGVEGIKKEAAVLGVKVTVFDGTFDAAKQYGQFQTVIASGSYSAILIDPVDTSGIVPLVQQAADAGILVGTWNQPIGTDLTSPVPTVNGVTTQVMTPPARNGEVAGALTKQACAEANANPCKVAVLNFMRGSTFDTAVDTAYAAAIADDSSIKIVNQVDTGATRDGGLKATQTILSAIPDVNVIVGAAQSITGASQAITAANLGRKIYLIAEGTTQSAAAEIKAGTIFAGTYLLPVDEGKLALDEIVKALKGQAFESAIDPAVVSKSSCNEGITAKNITECDFQFDG